MTGLQRNSAATFSFLIAIPAIAGAGFKEVLDYRSGAPLPIAAALIGSLTAFVVGYFSLKWLLSIVARGQLHWFAIYCMAVAVVTLAWQAGF